MERKNLSFQFEIKLIKVEAKTGENKTVEFRQLLKPGTDTISVRFYKRASKCPIEYYLFIFYFIMN